jgi:hypothetical protein
MRAVFLAPVLAPIIASAAIADGFDRPSSWRSNRARRKTMSSLRSGSHGRDGPPTRLLFTDTSDLKIEAGKPLLIVVTVFFDKDSKMAQVDYYSNQPKPDQQLTGSVPAPGLATELSCPASNNYNTGGPTSAKGSLESRS